jgi:hypothetical protein
MNIYFPIYAMMFLTLFVYLGLTISRGKPKDTPAFAGKTWGQVATQINAHIANLFETPVLFYVLLILAIMQNYKPTWFVLAAWLYVILRVFHAFIAITSNIVPLRALAFKASFAVLIALLLGVMTRL